MQKSPEKNVQKKKYKNYWIKTEAFESLYLSGGLERIRRMLTIGGMMTLFTRNNV